MLKKVSTLLLICLVLLTFMSCGLGYRYSLDESLHNQIDLVWNGKEPSHIIYKGVKYTFAETNFFNLGSHKDDIMLSWNGNRYFGYINEYYSYTSKNPLFIYHKSWVFFCDGYEYLTDTFVIENTSAEIVWNDIFESEQNGVDLVDSISVALHSKKCPRIKTELEMAYIDGKWYLSIPNTKSVWAVSDVFIDILYENEII